MGVAISFEQWAPRHMGHMGHMEASSFCRASLSSTYLIKQAYWEPLKLAFKSNYKYYFVCEMLRRNEKRFDKMLTTGNEEGC